MSRIITLLCLLGAASFPLIASGQIQQRPGPVQPEEGYKPAELSPEATPIETDFSKFRPDPVYEDKEYDADAQYAIYGGKKAVDKPRPFLEIGRDLYSVGPIGDGGITFGGKNRTYWQLLVHGDWRTAVAYNDQGNGIGQVATRLNLDVDLKLTATERIHAFFRPFDEKGMFSRYEFAGGDKMNDQLSFDTRAETLFLEGDLGAILSGWTDEYKKFDMPIAFGFMPMLMQNGVWFEDAFIGGAFTIAAKNSRRLDITNMDFTFFAGFDKVTTAATPDSDIFGVATFMDTREGYIEAGFGYVKDRSSGPVDLSYSNWTAAFTRRYGGKLSNSVRIILNTGQDSAFGSTKTANGFVVLIENSWVTSKPLTLVPYFNFWYGENRPQSLARAAGAGGVLRNTGLNFETDGLTGFPRLDDTANDTFGGAIGLEYLFDLSRQIVVEFATLQVQGNDPNRNAPGNQHAIGIRYGHNLTNRWLVRFDAMYGWIDGGGKDIAGAKVEFRRKF